MTTAGGSITFASVNNAITDTNWHMVTFVKDGTLRGDVYVDGVNVTNEAALSVSGTPSVQNDWRAIGLHLPGYTHAVNGNIEEFTIFDAQLTTAQIVYMYNGSAPEGIHVFSFGEGPAQTNTTLNITAVDDFNSTALQSFNATLSWSNGTTHNASTTAGSIDIEYLANDTKTVNVSFWGMTDYYNLTLYDQTVTSNSSNSIQGSVYQAYICFNASEYASAASVVANNFTIGSTIRTSCFNLTAASHNVMAQKTDWHDKNQTFTVSALDNTTTYTVKNMTYTNLTIYVVDRATGVHLTGYTINFTSLNHTGWAGDGASSVTNYTFDLINNTYNVTVDMPGYSATNTTKDVNVAGNTTYTFYLHKSNSLNFTIYKETTNTLLTGVTISIDIIQSNQTSNLSTTNGILYVTGLSSGELEIRYADNASVYGGRVYFVTMTNNTFQDVRLYLLNSTLGTLITFDVVDQNGQDLEGAIIKAQRFYPAENLYRTVAMTKSNFEGQGSIDLVKKITQANVFYKFLVEVNNSTKEDTTATEILANILYFTIDVLEDIFTSYDGIGDVEYNLTYSNTTLQFSFVWNDLTGLVREGCLKVIEHTPLKETLICNDCTESTSATLLCNITDTGNLFKAVGLIETLTNNSLYVVATESWSFDTKYLTFGAFGVFIAFLFIMTLAGVGMWNPVVAVVLSLVGLVFSVIIGLVNFTYISIVALVIVGGIAIAKMRT